MADSATSVAAPAAPAAPPCGTGDPAALAAEIALLARVAARQARVLVVDDMPAMRLLLAQSLRKAGFPEVLKAADGEAAMKLLRDTPCELVLADWNMPRLDGLGMLARVRRDPGLAALVFILVTAETLDQKVILAAEQGQDAYLTKPISPEKLTRRLELILEKRLALARSRRAECLDDPQGAREVLLAAAQARPSATWPLFHLGELLVRQGRPEEAARCFERSLAIDPGASRALLELGRLAEARGDRARARELLVEAVEQNPRFFPAYDALAGSFLAEGRGEAALAVLEKAFAARGTENAPRQALAGRLYYQGGRYGEAEAALSKSLRLGPREARAECQLTLARARLAQGRLGEALPALEAAAAKSEAEGDPLGKLDAMLLMGAVHAHRGHPEEAERVFARLADPGTWGGELPFREHHLERELGGVYLRAGETGRARELLAESLRQDPADRENLARVAQLCREAEQPELARRELRAAIEDRREGQVEEHSRRGLFLVRERRYEEAVAEYERGLALDPAAGRLRFNLGKLLLRMAREREGLAQLAAAIKLGFQARDWELVSEGTRILAGLGRTQEARGLLRKLALLAPGDPAVARVRGEFAESSAA